MRSSDLHLGDFVQISAPDLGGIRRVEIVGMDDSGFKVKWFTPEGLGPYYAMLPHGTFPQNTLRKVEFADERAGVHDSYWNWHSDFTGKTGEF